MTPEQFTDWFALHAAAEATRLGITPPQIAITRMACGQDSDIEFILTIRKRQRATLQYDEETKTSFIGPPPTNSDVPKVKLTPLMQSIVDAMTGQPARKAAWIASKCGKSCGGSFRNLLSDMVRFGVLKRGDAGGYQLA